MPQFHFAENFLPQLAWLALFFAILYFGIVKLTLPKVARVVDQREATVTGDLAAAEAAKRSSDELAVRYTADMDAAHRSARATILDAQGRAQANIEHSLSAAGALLGERQQVADDALGEARRSALAEIDAVAQDAAADIVERLTGRRPASKVVTQAARAMQVTHG